MRRLSGRVRHPKDKALSRTPSNSCTVRSTPTSRALAFHNLEDLNKAILHSLEVFNDRKLTGRECHAGNCSEEVEKDYLRPLPELRYPLKERKVRDSDEEQLCDAGTPSLQRADRLYREACRYSHPTSLSSSLDCGWSRCTSVTCMRTPRRATTAWTTRDLRQDLEEVYQRADMDNIVLLYLSGRWRHIKKYPLTPSVRVAWNPVLERIRTGPPRGGLRVRHDEVYGYQDVVCHPQPGDDRRFLPQADVPTRTGAYIARREHTRQE